MLLPSSLFSRKKNRIIMHFLTHPTFQAQLNNLVDVKVEHSKIIEKAEFNENEKEEVALIDGANNPIEPNLPDMNVPSHLEDHIEVDNQHIEVTHEDISIPVETTVDQSQDVGINDEITSTTAPLSQSQNVIENTSE